MKRKPKTLQQVLLERAGLIFWKRVQKQEGCWLWTGHLIKHGYGRFNCYGSQFSAHRISWELHFGVIPDGLFVLHKCDNPSCVRPEHLFVGTQADNVRDMTKKGRAHKASGEDHASVKLTWKKVRSIRERYAAGGISVRQLAREHGLTNGAMWQAIREKTWKEIRT